MAAKCLNPKPPSSWVIPPFEETQGRLKHMFRRDDGHLSKDTRENRTYIRTAASDPANRESINKHGVELYSKIMPDGYRAWAYVKDGLIVNGGRDKPWVKWVASDKPTGPGGKVEPRNFRTKEEFTFQERIQADRLTKVYNASVRNNPWPPHPTESKNAGRDVGEIHHQAGIIMEARAQKKEVDPLTKCSDFSLMEIAGTPPTEEEKSWCFLM